MDWKLNTIQIIPGDINDKNYIQLDNIGDKFDKIYELQEDFNRGIN